MNQRRDGFSPHCKVCDYERRSVTRGSPTGRRKGVVRYTLAERKKRYRSRHPERQKAADDKRRQSGYFSRYAIERYRRDPLYNLVQRLRRRTTKALRGESKSASTLCLVGCSVEALRGWIELQFKPGMSWDNRDEWELDHKRPLASFDLSDPTQQAVAFHWKNLQPLWRRENRSKGAKWI